jgi:predicted negative regulator of RcsB-dependent stress response
MINFFRKIRQNLLMENKTGKYFKYAIGEIILVVIGILIALQINNWNEQRKEKQLEINAMSEVRDDLVNSMIDINQNLRLMSNWLESAWKIKRLINTSEVFPDSLGADLLKMTRDEYLFTNSKTYTALKSAGFKVIKNDKIRRELDYLYEAMYPRLAAITSLEPDIKAYFSDYVKNNFRAISRDTLYKSGVKVEDIASSKLGDVGWGSWSRFVPTNYDHFRTDPEFTILLENSIRWRMMKIIKYREAKRGTVETIDLIEAKIKGKIKLSQIRRLEHLTDQEKGVDLIIDIIKKGDTDDQGYDISESAINRLGYRLVAAKDDYGALRILKLNTEKYPNAFNTYDSYGEILLLIGDKENAIDAYKKSLELNPDNENAKKVLSEIK